MYMYFLPKVSLPPPPLPSAEKYSQALISRVLPTNVDTKLQNTVFQRTLPPTWECREDITYPGLPIASAILFVGNVQDVYTYAMIFYRILSQRHIKYISIVPILTVRACSPTFIMPYLNGNIPLDEFKLNEGRGQHSERKNHNFSDKDIVHDPSSVATATCVLEFHSLRLSLISIVVARNLFA